MIKRSGVEIMNARTKNVSLAKETIDVCKKKQYTSLNGSVVDFSESLDYALKGTVLYKDHVPPKEHTEITPFIEVTNETTSQAAARLAQLGKTDIVALNFASARNQGGGFLSGAIAQEEDLCRSSGLYPCLKSKPIFYNENILCDDPYYTDNIIYSPNVPFFRNEHNLFLEEPFLLSIISAPAPNMNASKHINDKVVLDRLSYRTEKILNIAQWNNHKTIILGAWGCGAFGNDPRVVSVVFRNALKALPVFEHITFAVYDTREPPVLFETFKEAFL